MAKLNQKPVPKYDSPPVIETMLGVEFAPLEKWSIPHFGMFWNQVKGEFPRFDIQPPLLSQIEAFDKPTLVFQPSFVMVKEPEIRCWFIKKDDREVIQVQGNRFTYNWRKIESADSYPRYDDCIRPAFQQAWQRFVTFVNENQLGALNVVQCEVSYINHLEIGKGWTAASDIPKVFPCWSGKSSGDFLPAPENAGFDVSYRMPDKKGRLRISLKPAIRNHDGAEILMLTLTARGKPEGSEIESLLNWLDMGREWVVRGFTDFTSTEMHALWQRRI